MFQDITVTPITEEDSDLKIVNAARVSFDKQSEWDCGVSPTNELRHFLSDRDQRLLNFLARHNHWTPFAHCHITVARVLSKDEVLDWLMVRGPGVESARYDYGDKIQLIETGSVYAWVKHIQKRNLPERQVSDLATIIMRRHPWTFQAFSIDVKPKAYLDDLHDVTDTVARLGVPELMTATFKIDAPFYVRTQAFKHKFGFVENEVSRRYVRTAPSVHNITHFRAAVADKKQGSGDVITDRMPEMIYKTVMSNAVSSYNGLLELGVCEEQARSVLPVGAMTSWYWTGTFAAYQRMMDQRLKPDTQPETSELASKIGNHLERMHPDWF